MGSTVRFSLLCARTSCPWFVGISPSFANGSAHPFDPCGNEVGPTPPILTAVCNPFSIRFGGFVAACCPGAAYDWVVTP